MFIKFTTPAGKTYKVAVSQVSVHTVDGWPCALAYTRDGLIVYADANDADFGGQTKTLLIQREEPPK